MRFLSFVCLFFLISINNVSGEVMSHFLDLEIDPSRHFINAKDTIHLNNETGSVSFHLNKDLKILSIFSKIKPLEYTTSVTNDSQEVVVKTGGAKYITIHYEGAIFDEIRKAETITFVKGDRTKGIISEKGVFLSPESGWYPDNGGLSIYNLKVKIKGGLKTVTQGELIERRYDGDIEYSEWKGSVPVDGLYLIASRFVIDTVDVGGIRYSTYLTEENAHLSKVFIEGSKRYIEFYSRIIGDYPFRDWTVVENFFSSGYGMPGFTLLDPLVIRQGERILRPGYIDHEIVHSWFGNYVYPDYSKGNWVEAITTYLTNYYYKEVFSGEDEARRYRISTIERYSIRVNPEKDYPLRRFVTKEEDFENDIGYGKGSMVFHALRRLVGDRIFFDSIKTVVERFGGKRASWDDLRGIFEEKSGKDLKIFFNEWLERKGGPELRLFDVAIEAGDKGYRIKGKIIQEADIYELMIPVVVFTKKGKKEIIINLKDKTGSFDIVVDERPESVEIDPDYHIFRIIPDDDLNPSLNLFLSRKKRFYILTEDRFRNAFKELTGRLMITGGEIIPQEKMDGYKSKGSFFIFGKPSHPLTTQIFTVEDNGFVFKGKEFKGSEYSVLFSIRNPYNEKEVIVFYYGNSPEALEKARYLPYYGTDTYVIFRSGQPIERGYLGETKLRTRYIFGDIDIRRLQEHINYLASPERKGRLPGTEEDRAVRKYLLAKLRECGFDAHEQEFIIYESEVDKRRLKTGVSFPVRTGNVYGIKKGDMDEFIILSAHHDHHGVDREGNVYCGADDNASGVAVLLEIARNLSNHRFKKGLIILFPGAEEWGLKGSRYFVKNPPVRIDKISSLINVDSIGRGDRTVYFIGSSFYPELGFKIKKYLDDNLKEGRDIDRHAFKEGSDHYSFHEAGIPCIDIFSSDYRMLDRPGDEPSKIDYEKMIAIGMSLYKGIVEMLSLL
ncbi:MAG: M20/M25/M40 family metallo-hydrolase [Thermodesulfovibrionales bacterium]